MNINFIFDVDGTLTDSRKEVDWKFEQYLTYALHRKSPNTSFTLISGSDLKKIREQISYSLLYAFDNCFGCSGSESLHSEHQIPFHPPPRMMGMLQDWLDNYSEYPLRTGYHIEYRNGCMNYSTVGRAATDEERADYNLYDSQRHEREQIARELMRRFPDYVACIGGKISIDIMHKDRTKAQILKHFDPTDQFIFYGDGFGTYGNDIPLAEAILKLPNPYNRIVWTAGWKSTWSSIKQEKYIFGD